MAILGKVSQIMKDSQSPVKPLGSPSGAPRTPVSADQFLLEVLGFLERSQPPRRLTRCDDRQAHSRPSPAQRG